MYRVLSPAIAVSLMVATFGFFAPGVGASCQPARTGETLAGKVRPSTLKPGRTVLPAMLPQDVDLAEAARTGRATAIRLKGIKAVAPSNGGFIVRLAGDDTPIGTFNTFSLVGKVAGEDRTIMLRDLGLFLSALANNPDCVRIEIETPAFFSELITIDRVDLIVEARQ